MNSVLSSEKVQPYGNALEHLGDLLKLLELWIRRELIVHRTLRDQGEAWAGFMAITDKEVDALLSGSDAGVSPEITAAQKSVEQNLAETASFIERRTESSINAGIALPFVELAGIFGLSAWETKALIACLGPEIARRYERLYGYLQDDMTRRRPSLGLILAFCSQAPGDEIRLRPIFSSRAPLIRYQLLQIVEEAAGGNPFLSRTAKIDGRIASFLLGERGFDSRIQDQVEWLAPAETPPAPNTTQATQADQLIAAIEGCFGKRGLEKKPLLYLFGQPRAGKGALVREVCRRLRLPLLVVDAEQLAAGPIGLDEGLFAVFRENVLSQSAIHIQRLDRVLEQNRDRPRLKALMRHVQAMGGITFLSGEKPWSWQVSHDHILFLPLELRGPEYAEQVELWKSALQGQSDLNEQDLLRVVSKYPCSHGQIEDAAIMAKTHAALRGDNGMVTMRDIDRGCRAQSQPEFGHLARKIEAKHRWDDIILPPTQVSQLREICNHVHYRSVVFGTWGFGRKLSLGKGLNALFCGPPGTGKTMAAEVIADELQLDLYKIDLSQVVSKYIGETEKNLHQIFNEAQTCHAILFFDEADALLGKRSDVKDAHDRYANLEIAYLLQKMEEYEGVTILATNLRQNMDEAFTRRIRFIVDFPFPEEEYRHRIWQGIWPKETPLAEDVELGSLARRFKLCGGNIRNIAVTAAFSASSNGQRVDMKHLLNATRQEFLKMGRLVNESEYGG